MSIWRPVTNALLSALLSPPCAACGRVLDAPLEGAVCASCWTAVAPASCPSCRTCPSITRGCAVGEYAGALREIIHALKYDGRRSVAPRLGAIMAEHGCDVLDDAAFVVPVPLHRTRERERGFNQADDLARALGLPVARVLRRVRHTSPQVDLPAAERQRNVREAFVAVSCATPDPSVAGAIVVLVDDVVTTGATLEACGQVLRACGAREVRAITAAQVASAPR